MTSLIQLALSQIQLFALPDEFSIRLIFRWHCIRHLSLLPLLPCVFLMLCVYGLKRDNVERLLLFHAQIRHEGTTDDTGSAIRHHPNILRAMLRSIPVGNDVLTQMPAEAAMQQKHRAWFAHLYGYGRGVAGAVAASMNANTPLTVNDAGQIGQVDRRDGQDAALTFVNCFTNCCAASIVKSFVSLFGFFAGKLFPLFFGNIESGHRISFADLRSRLSWCSNTDSAIYSITLRAVAS